MRYRTYTLRIEAADDASITIDELDSLSAGIQHAEDGINDRLPEGFYCKIDDSGEGVDLAAVQDLERMAAANEAHHREPDGTRLSNNLTIHIDR